MTTVSGRNIREIPEIIDTVVKYGVDVYAFARYCPTSADKDTGITPQEYRELLVLSDQEFKAYETAGCGTYFNQKEHLGTLAEKGMIYGGCNCGNCHLTILPTGDIFACRRIQNSKVGSVFEDRLADVWVCGMEAYRDYTKFKKCAKCKLLAWCRGCPAVASGAHGDFYDADPHVGKR